MKILLVNDYGAVVGGAEQYLFQLADGLRARGHAVQIASSERLRDHQPLRSDIQLSSSGHWRNLDALFNPRSYFEIKRVIDDFKPDVVHFQNVFYMLSPSVLFASRRLKTILTVHDYFAICLGDKTLVNGGVCTKALRDCHDCERSCAKPTFERIRRRIAQRALRTVDTVIAPSQFVADEFARNGIDGLRVLAHPIRPAVGYEHAEHKPTRLLFVGRLVSQKGIDVALRALVTLITRFADIELRIVGDGAEREALITLSKSLGISKHVTFCGWKAPEDVAREYAEAGLLLQPAQWPEVSGLTVGEAAAWGVPAVVADVGALPTAVASGNGVVYSPHTDAQALADAIATLVSDRDAYTQCRTFASEYAMRHALSSHVEQLEEVYQQ